jgi:hypothetical protein
MSNLDSWLCKRKVKIHTDNTAAIFTKKEASVQTEAKTIRTRNSMFGRSRIFGHALRKEFDIEGTH